MATVSSYGKLMEAEVRKMFWDRLVDKDSWFLVDGDQVRNWNQVDPDPLQAAIDQEVEKLIG